MRTDQIALQLYTVRRLMATDLPGTLAAVANAGYRAVELAGLPATPPAELSRLLGGAGLQVVASHESVDALRQDAAGVAERLSALDCPRAVVPWMPEQDRKTADDVRRFAAELATFAEAFGDRGIRLGYHNHAFEFGRLDGTTIWDLLLGALPAAVEIELDVHWVAAGGRDPVAEIQGVGDRVRLLHMKDRTGSRAAGRPARGGDPAVSGDRRGGSRRRRRVVRRRAGRATSPPRRHRQRTAISRDPGRPQPMTVAFAWMSPAPASASSAGSSVTHADRIGRSHHGVGAIVNRSSPRRTLS